THTAEREPAPSTNGFRPGNGAQATAQPASADGIGPADGARPADGSRPANGTRPGSAGGTGPGHHGEVTQGERRGRWSARRPGRGAPDGGAHGGRRGR